RYQKPGLRCLRRRCDLRKCDFRTTRPGDTDQPEKQHAIAAVYCRTTCRRDNPGDRTRLRGMIIEGRNSLAHRSQILSLPIASPSDNRRPKSRADGAEWLETECRRR